MTAPHAESTFAANTRRREARRVACRVSAQGCRWWPLQEPWEITDGPAKCVCLNCGDVVALQAAFPSYPKRKR